MVKHYCKNGLLDRRWRVNKTLEAKELMFWRKHGTAIASVILIALSGILLIGSLYQAPKAKSVNLKPVGEATLIKNIEAKEIPFCSTPIDCIRDVGEEMGESNQHIITMIKLAKCESSMNPEALNKNKNGTFDVGLLQINDVHSKRISRQDRMDYEKNIRFAYKLHQEQKHSFSAWSCSSKI